MVGREAVEVAKAVLEVAAVETYDHEPNYSAAELESLKLENQRLRNLLQTISVSPLFSDLPADLHQRLVSTVEPDKFLNRLESLSTANTNSGFSFKDPSEDMAPSNIEEKTGVDNENYVVVSEEHVVEGVANFMARCILSCPKTKDMSPHELQTTLSKALGGMNKVEKMINIWHAGKMFYTLSTWGLALTGLYRSRAILKLAAMGVHSTSKVVLRAL